MSVTRGLALVDDGTDVASMQAVNATVRNLPFALAFFGAPVLTALVLVRRRGTAAASALVAAGFVLYLVGTSLVTFLINVPLNEELAAVTDDPGAARAAYESSWNSAKRVRTLAPLAAFARLALGLAIDRRATVVPAVHRDR